MVMLGRFHVPTWLLMISGAVVSIIALVRLHLDDAFLGIVGRFGEGVVTAEREVAKLPAVGRVWNWFRAITAKVYPYIRETVEFLTAPLHPERLEREILGWKLVREEGGRAQWAGQVFEDYILEPVPKVIGGLKATPGWDILFTLSAAIGVCLAFLGFYKTVFPRKYEFKSRDYSKPY